jgi:CheY-like chemotaxis protein
MDSEIKVLIIDDDDVILFLHDLMIRDSGLSQDTESFLRAEHALDYLESHHAENGHYLVFLDINMPGMNGWQFLEYLAKTSYQNKVSVVLVTSSIENADHEKARAYPAVVEYIEKPLSMAICARIREMMLK